MNAVLLTGAGFTKTFGGYLASEMWAAILNQPEVQNSPDLLKGMRDLENLDYEMFYEEIQAKGTEKQKKDLNAAIRSAFKEMDDNIRTRKPFSLAHSCCRFITRIAQDQAPSFIFTLNQDMFFERYHSREQITVVPGVPEHLRRFRETDQDSSQFHLRLPKEEELEARKSDLFKKGFAQIAYVKLHGSQGWLSHDDVDVMVIGTQKESRIESEPLLKWYFSLFEQVLNRPETHLLIVGYGFGDAHVNECIVKAIGKGLKLYVISPQSPQDFRNLFKTPLHGILVKKPFGDELWEGLAQYWPATLTDFYYDNESPPRDLNPRGRALFRSLGLI
jgi:SIR2-like domain